MQPNLQSPIDRLAHDASKSNANANTLSPAPTPPTREKHTLENERNNRIDITVQLQRERRISKVAERRRERSVDNRIGASGVQVDSRSHARRYSLFPPKNKMNDKK